MFQCCPRCVVSFIDGVGLARGAGGSHLDLEQRLHIVIELATLSVRPDQPQIVLAAWCGAAADHHGEARAPRLGDDRPANVAGGGACHTDWPVVKFSTEGFSVTAMSIGNPACRGMTRTQLPSVEKAATCSPSSCWTLAPSSTSRIEVSADAASVSTRYRPRC